MHLRGLGMIRNWSSGYKEWRHMLCIQMNMRFWQAGTRGHHDSAPSLASVQRSADGCTDVSKICIGPIKEYFSKGKKKQIKKRYWPWLMNYHLDYTCGKFCLLALICCAAEVFCIFLSEFMSWKCKENCGIKIFEYSNIRWKNQRIFEYSFEYVSMFRIYSNIRSDHFFNIRSSLMHWRTDIQ